jgi:hypothetical protein
MFGRNLHYIYVCYLLSHIIILLQLGMPLYKLVILPVLVPHRQYKRCRRRKKNVVICFVGAFLVNVVISEGTDEVGFGCYDAVVLEMVEDQRLAAGSGRSRRRYGNTVWNKRVLAGGGYWVSI